MRGPVAILAAVLAAAACRGEEAPPAGALAAVKEATVLITTAGEEGGGAVSGSGFLIRAEGEGGYVVTNHHVIDPGGARARGGPRVVFRSGTSRERTAAAEVVADAPEPDLAILRVAGVPDLPRPIDPRAEPELVETTPVYAFGFPFGRALAPGRGRPAVVVGKGSLSSVRRDGSGRARTVLIEGELNPGNSGGPVVDGRGRLVGIAVATVREARIGVAIAAPELLDMLEGRPGEPRLAVRSARLGSLELDAEVPLFDPLGQTKGLAILYTPERTGDEDVPPGEPLPGARRAELKVEGGRARGTLAVAAPAGQDVDLAYQVARVDGRGKAVLARRGRYLLAAPRGAAGGFEPLGDVVDPDGDCTVGLAGGAIALEVPGSLHDLACEVGKTNAPRVVREVEGDFVAEVRVAAEFQPAGPSTRDDLLPFHGAGLLVWLDPENYVRVERAAHLRNGRVGAYFLFERRERGRLAARRNGYLEEGDVSLRVERRGGRVSASFSTDGRAWSSAEPMAVAWPRAVKVGVGAVNTASGPLSVRFEGLSVGVPRPAAP